MVLVNSVMDPVNIRSIEFSATQIIFHLIDGGTIRIYIVDDRLEIE